MSAPDPQAQRDAVGGLREAVAAVLSMRDHDIECVETQVRGKCDCWQDDLRRVLAQHAPAAEASAAEVLAAHWSYEPAPDFDGWLCECGDRIADRDVDDLDVAMQAHVAAALAKAGLLTTGGTA